MSYMDEYNKLKKKRLQEETKTSAKNSGASSYMNEYNKLRGQSTVESVFNRVVRPTIELGKKDEETKKTKETESKKEERKWFDTSVFDDGFQWSDIPKAVVGTSTDVKKNLWSGILGIGEKVVDAGMTVGTAMNQSSMMQAANSQIMLNAISGNKTDAGTVLSQYQKAQDEAEKATAKFVAKDLYDEEKIARKIISDPIKKLTGIDSEKDSLLGAKSDSLVQSGGQLIAQLGANAIAPGSGMALMAVTAFGSEAESAFKNDATFDEALLSATISAGAEVLTEKIGGISFGGRTLTDAAFELLSRKMTSTIAKVLITTGKVAADMTAEGAEEVLSGYMSAIGQKLTYMEDKEIEELFSNEDMLESFIGGAVLGGAGSVGGVIQAKSRGVDYVTGLTKNEQAVAQKVYEDELAKKEEKGKVSSREKTKLYNAVIKDMELGRIDTDTIESVLGGESYKGYQSMVEQESSIKEEIEALENTPENQFTVKQRERLTELREQLKGIDTKTAKSNLFSEVDKLTANDTKLRESYNEKARRGQNFEADLTKYDAKQQETIQKAIDSGILNNTNRTHEFVDLVAKISADKGVPFVFTNNQKLKESGFAIDGKQVNGFVTKDGVTLNVNSAKSLDTVVGHEITHVLEGTELYNELQTAIVEYAKSKGDYQGRYDALTKLYENVEGANIDAELTAELVGDYIFTDTDFIHNLSTNNRNVFQKVYDEIKYLYKVATAGSKEARELERVKKIFDEAYRGEIKKSEPSTAAQEDGSVKKQLSTAEEVTEEQNKRGVDAKSEVQYSLSRDSEYMDRSISANNSALHVSNDNMLAAKAVRERIATRMNDIKDRGLVALPDDVEGNTYIANSSYDGTEENTTICPRSLASEAFTDAVSEYLGRPLTVEEQIYISQDLQGRSLTPECTYCYVATDRKAYRAFLGEYINQRDTVIQKVKENPSADITRNGNLYKEFLNGRKDTKPMYDRFKMWVDSYKNGKPMIEASNLANINKLMGDINSEFGAELKPQIVDAMKYAQSASWAKKRINYVAYNGHILNWKQDRINKLNSHYGLRMYSFSDFHPAFVLENMQMITDASVRGLKMLGYTKDMDFVEIFAPSGMNINVSTFGFETNGNVYENNIIGAEWEKAKALREQYPNVGVTFVATDDNLVNWALDQDWIDVVIPYHLVRTGAEVAKAFGYTNYTSESADTKDVGWAKGSDKKYIAPTEHNNDKATYLEALAKNHLKPRFERFLDNPNYMKLVNECRQSASESKPVQPTFNENAAMVALAKLEANGYYQPIGGSVDRMYEIAAEVAEDMTKQLAPAGQYSLSEKDAAPTGKFLGKDMALETAPVAEAVETEVAPAVETKVEDYAPGESLEERLAKADESLESLDTETEVLFRDLSEQKITEEEFAQKWKDLDNRFTQARQEQERLSAEMTDINNRKYESIEDSDIPPEVEAPYYGDAESVAPVDPFAQRDMTDVGKRNVKAYMSEHPEVTPFFQDAARGMLYDLQNGTKGERIFNEQMHYESGYEKGWMGTSRRTTGDIADLLDQWGYSYAQIEAGLNAIIEGGGKENNAVSKRIEFMLDNRLRNGYKDVDGRPIPADDGYINLLKEMQIDEYRSESFDSFMEVADQYAPPAEEIAPVKTEPAAEGTQDALEGFEQAEQEPERLTRAKLHSQIVDSIKAEFNRKGLDFDKVLKNAHRMNALSINDNTPQRVNDKTFGYEAGEALNEVTFNRVALRESNGIKWLNKQVDTIRNLSKKYNIKPLSKESAAAQMYAEGFWVNDKDEIIAYGDAELAQDFPDIQVQNRIKALASDPTIRKIYDDTLTAINESRARNAYPEIPRLENYYLHFRAMDDTFSRLGVPFNPNDIKAKDLPTDINGTTIDRKPGQPFFASSMHREGKRTSFDLFGGLEKYLNSAKNQIYHIDDIQTARALWGYIADRYGQAHGLENLDQMAYEAQAEHIQQVYDGHLSNYARFLVEYANHLAGKTALIDRGVEGLIGRRALQFINTVNMQTSRNQVGYSISSPLTNFIPSMEAIARTSKRDSIKAFAQTVSNVFRKDGFVENDLTLIRRKGADKFSKTLWEKLSDPGFILMGAVDSVTSEFIVRTKYNELTRKGMDSKQAHIKAGEWASRIMGDRSLGQMPLHYNSKFMGLFTKYQLEVRNALDSQFYDTYQEAKANTKEVENQKAKNALTATKFAYRAVQIAALNHVFGMAFEKIAGYNPAFDIISTIATLFGWDDDDEEDTFADNAEQAFKELLGDLPYTSMFTENGRIPIGSALPIKQLVSGVDKYGNEKSRWETLLEAAPYYLLPGGYGQIKKTAQGLGMFSDEHPISGSYTDSGNLRYPVEKTFGNVLQAGVFGQYASENARDYFDNERSPLKEKQIQEFIDVDIPIKDYWEYREGLAKLKTNEEKVDYIDSLDLPLSKKNILVNNVLDRKEDVDLADYGEYGSLAEFDFALKYPEKYQFLEENGVTFDAYSKFNEDTKDAYNWAFQNPDKYTVSKAIAEDVVQYKSYTKGLSEIEADKDENGKSINGSRKDKVFAYIESLPLDYGQKCILFKSQYKADDSMNMDIIEYLDSREDIDYEAMVTILKELDFIVEGNNVYWD